MFASKDLGMESWYSVKIHRGRLSIGSASYVLLRQDGEFASVFASSRACRRCPGGSVAVRPPSPPHGFEGN